MGKFKINLEIQALKIEIEGSKEDAPMIASNLGRQFSGLLGPAISIVEGEEVSDGERAVPIQVLPAADTSTSKRKSRRKRSISPNGDEATATGKAPVAIDWRHDVEKFGSPQQGWSGATKAIWLLWVISQQTQFVELTRFQIEETFNKHFKSAGILRQANIQRDLSKEKQKKPALVSEDTTQNPTLWFLTDAGKKRGQALVIEALGGQLAGETATQPESPA